MPRLLRPGVRYRPALVPIFTTVVLAAPVLLHSQSSQTSEQKPLSFEVASVKMNTSGDSGFIERPTSD